MRITDAARINGHSRVDVAISAVATQTGVLTEGIYDVWADVDCWLKMAITANDVTSAAGANTGYMLKANNAVTFDIHGGDRIGVVAGGSGTLSYHRVG